MAEDMDNDDGGKKYKIIINGVEGNNSRQYTGYAKAIYPTEPEEIYEGQYIDGKRCGKGTYTYKNGDIYEGDWKENQKHGLGLIKYLNEGEYFGRFENGRRHGEGVFTYKKTNDTYSGFWKYGNKHGEGIYTFNSSKLKLCGDWENGNFIKGKWIFPNGIYWQGEFKKNKPQGIGRWIFPDGNTVEGKFTQLEDEEAEPLPETDEKPIKLNWSTTTKIYNPDAFEDLDINF